MAGIVRSTLVVACILACGVFGACGSSDSPGETPDGGGGTDDANGGDGALPDGATSAACTTTTNANDSTKIHVAVNTQAGHWRTVQDPATCRFSLVGTDDKPSVLRGVSMTGLETGTRETGSGGGFWLFQSGISGASEKVNAPIVLGNVIDTLATKWKPKVVRIPLCSSGWVQNYQVHDFAVPTPGAVMDYQSWFDLAVKRARADGAVVIIDNHLWAIAKMGIGGVDRGSFTSNGQTHKYSEYEDGCTGVNTVTSGGVTTDSCAPEDFFTGDPSKWECPIANADGVSIQNAYYNKDKIAAAWTDIATRYKGDENVWFELLNEPYTRKIAPGATFPTAGVNDDDANYPWDLWSAYMMEQIQAIRDKAGASNMIIVNGLDFGYDFGPEYGPIAHPDKYLPWVTKYANIGYSFHPYQFGSCCGDIGASGTDLSATDPYESAFCSFYPDGSQQGTPSGSALPGGATCKNAGYGASPDKKMPPCTWVATAKNPATGALGLCAGDRAICNPKNQADCQAVDSATPAAGGWSKYVLPMAAFGPLVVTEYGSFDCSSPYVKRLFAFMDTYKISSTAWALWPQNQGGPADLGACGYPSVMAPVPPVDNASDFRACFDAAACSGLLEPLPWSGKLTFDTLTTP